VRFGGLVSWRRADRWRRSARFVDVIFGSPWAGGFCRAMITPRRRVSNASTAMSMYLSVDAASAQVAILTAAAESVMTNDEVEVFAALMTTVRAAHKHRNKHAHWHWGCSDEITDGLLLIEPKYRLRHTSAWWSTYMQTGQFNEDMRLYNRDEIMVVKTDDLARSLREIREAVRLLRLLHRVFLVKLAGDPQVRETSADLLRQLSDEPSIREALLRSQAR
jgi:hypothetical protein